MPLSISNLTGDGVTDDHIAVAVSLPDINAGNLLLSGSVQAKGAAPQNVTGSPIALPAAPAAGSIFLNVQVDVTTGAATLQQSAVAAPAPINPNNRIVYGMTLLPSNTSPALDAGTTPDPALGQS